MSMANRTKLLHTIPENIHLKPMYRSVIYAYIIPCTKDIIDSGRYVLFKKKFIKISSMLSGNAFQRDEDCKVIELGINTK